MDGSMDVIEITENPGSGITITVELTDDEDREFRSRFPATDLDTGEMLKRELMKLAHAMQLDS